MCNLKSKILLLFLLFILPFKVCKSQKSTLDNTKIEIYGQFNLGGLFPVHKPTSNEFKCGGEINPNVVQAVEAMLFAIDKINNDADFFRFVSTSFTLKFGTKIFDTCSASAVALEKSIEFIPKAIANKGCISNEGLRLDVEGVIGGLWSDVSISVASLLKIFKIPQISYGSTSALLSDKRKYNYYARTVPSDTYQARAMADIVHAFNWSYVSTVASEGAYGEGGIEIFEEEVKSKNVCVALSITIPSSANATTFDDIIDRLRGKPRARAIVVFLNNVDIPPLLEAYKRSTVEEGHFIWIASESWFSVLDIEKNLGKEAEGAITLSLQNSPIIEFDHYFLNLRPETNERNPWFAEFWEHQFKCGSNQSETTCDGSESLTNTDYKQFPFVPQVVNSVYSMAYGIQNIVRQLCLNINCAEYMRISGPPTISGEDLYSEIVGLKFTGVDGSYVQYDSNGDGLPIYSIMNFQRSNKEYKFQKLGTWAYENMLMETSKAKFGQKNSDQNAAGIPYSYCTETCKPGEYRRVLDRCCWECSKCVSYQYLRDEFTCADCPEGFWPNDDFSSCNKLPYQTIRWSEPIRLISIILASIGVAFTLVIMRIFIKYKDTPVVTTSCREMSFTLLAGILMCYVMIYVELMKPSFIVCTIKRLGLGLSFSICYASILTKINRISRIFKKLQFSMRPAKYIGPASQIFICFCIFGFQLVIEILWLAFNPSSTIEVVPRREEPIVIETCGVGEIEIITFMTFYNLILVMVCTIYAVRVRNIPAKFNETKYITFSNWSTLIVWIAFFIIFFSVGENSEAKFTTMTTSVGFLNASSILVCLFFPKVYIILFRPDKNVLTSRDYSSLLKNKMDSPKLASPAKVGSTLKAESTSQKLSTSDD